MTTNATGVGGVRVTVPDTESRDTVTRTSRRRDGFVKSGTIQLYDFIIAEERDINMFGRENVTPEYKQWVTARFNRMVKDGA